MLTNTGQLSFYFGIGLCVLAFLAVAVAFYCVISGRIEQQKLDRLIELGKWYVISIALVISAAIVTDSFKQREEDIKEVEVFDKHVDTIIAADGIERRWLLADYFSIVAPSGELRTSWSNYKSHIEKDLQDYRAGKEKLSELAAKSQPSQTERQQITELQNKTTLLDQSLIDKKPSSNGWVIVAGTDVSFSEAQFELEKSRNVSVAAKVYKVGNQYRTIIPGFASWDDASRELPEVQKIINPTAYILELKTWCINPKNRGSFVECQ